MANDLNVSGATTVNGGEYGDIKVSGNCKINGDVTAEDIRVSGKFSADGALNAASLNCAGKVDILGKVNIDEVKVSGKIDINGNVSGSTFKVAGFAEINGNMEMDEFNCSGRILMEGMLNADEVNIKVNEQSRIKEIGGSEITIKEGRNGIAGLFNKQTGMLECESIEGDEIYLENVKADFVSGTEVVIGKNCVIKTVEYIDELQINDNAEVKEQMKTS